MEILLSKKLKFVLANCCLLLAINLKLAQAQYYNNVNQELCYQLYEVLDPLSAYRVCIVIDTETFTKTDSLMLSQWPKLSQFQKQQVTQRWAVEGRRIESERMPYISYPPVWPNNNPFIKPIPINQKIDWEKTPWNKAKEFWAYPDRPF